MAGGAAGAGRPARELVEFLREVPLFATLDEALRAEIAVTARVVSVPAGTCIFREGDPGDALYAVWSGRLEVLGSPDGRPSALLGRGAAVGELALLTGEPRTASVRAVRDSELVLLDRPRFDTLLRENADFGMALTGILGRRLAGTVRATGTPLERRAVLAVVALSPRVPLDTHVDHLLRNLGAWARADTLTQQDVAGTREAEHGRRLDRCERRNDVVVLPVPAAASASWRDFCLRQADRVLAVADAREPAALPPDDRLRGCDLAFWGPRPPSAAFSRRILDRLRPRALHWVPLGAGAVPGLERTTRRIFGRSIGVVLSGGGARGFAHVGVMAALQAAGLPVDRFGGTSMGAFISGLFATGLTWQEVRAILEEEVARRRPFADYTVPRRALVRGRRARRMLRRVFGELHGEELPLDWFGISADLLTAETLVHRRGLVRHSVGASMSLPGVAPPMAAAGRLLVDGGVLNNLPVDVMAATGEGPVVAVEAMRRWKAQWEQRTASEPRRLLGGNRRQVPLPSITETIARSSMLGASRWADSCRDLSWLNVTPELADIGLLDWRRLDEAVAEGRRAAETALEHAPPLPLGALAARER